MDSTSMKDIRSPNYGNFKSEKMSTFLQQFSIKSLDFNTQHVVYNDIFPWSYGVSVLAVFTVMAKTNNVSE